MTKPLLSLRALGILWVVAGFVSLSLAYIRQPTERPLLALGVVIVAVGAAMIRRSGRQRGGR